MKKVKVLAVNIQCVAIEVFHTKSHAVKYFDCVALHIYQWNIPIRRGLHILPVSFLS